MAEIASSIVESKILRVHAVCCEWAGWALHVADGVSRVALSFGGGAVPPVISFTMVRVATTLSIYCGRPRTFGSLMGQLSLGINWRRTGRKHSTLGMAQRAYTLNRVVRRHWPVSDRFGRHI